MRALWVAESRRRRAQHMTEVLHDDDSSDDEKDVVVIDDADDSHNAATARLWSNLADDDSDEESESAASSTDCGEWKALRDRLLLAKLLELEQPVITDKMIDFLLQDGVCETFVSFITQVLPAGSNEKPVRLGLEFGCKPTTELQRSYRATLLLASEEPTDALLTFLGKKAAVITTAIFDGFRPDACGSFHHMCRILDHLMRFHGDQVLETLGQTWRIAQNYVTLMLSHIAHAPVAETFVRLITCGAGVPGMAVPSPPSKWKFYRALAHWKFALVLVEGIVGADSSPAHATACTDAFVEIVERLIVDENGELLLQPIGHCESLVDGLLDCAAGVPRDPRNGTSPPYEQRVDAARALQALVHSSREPEIALSTHGTPYQPAETKMVRNQLHSVAALLSTHLEARLDVLLAVATSKIALGAGGGPVAPGPSGGGPAAGGQSGGAPSGNAVLRDETGTNGAGSSVNLADADEQQCANVNSSASEAIEHPGGYSAPPFTLLRFLVVGTIVELTCSATAEPPGSAASRVLELIAREPNLSFWKQLCTWLFVHTDNNLFHNLFYRLFFFTLRQNHEKSLQYVLQKCRLITHCVDIYHAQPGASNVGCILRLCNAIRLQAATLPPSAFLRNFLQSHASWRKFLPVLEDVTIKQQCHGLGFGVPKQNGLCGGGPGGVGGGASADALLLSAGDDGIDLGSEYAKCMGFGVEVSWEPTDGTSPRRKKGSKEKKRRKRRGKAQHGEGADGAEEDQEED